MPPLQTRLNFAQRDQADDSPIPEPAPYQPGRKNTPPAIHADLTRRVVRYRVWHRKEGRAAWLSQLELQALLERALRRAAVPLAFSQGFHPLPLLSFGRALPVGMSSMAEWFALTLRSLLSPSELADRLGPRMLEGMGLVSVDPMPLTGKIVSASEEWFRMACPVIQGGKGDQPDPRFRRSWEEFMDSGSHVMERRNKQGELKMLDIRPLLRDVDFRDRAVIFSLDWTGAYLSPLTFVREVVPWLEPSRVELIKLAQTL